MDYYDEEVLFANRFSFNLSWLQLEGEDIYCWGGSIVVPFRAYGETAQCFRIFK